MPVIDPDRSSLIVVMQVIDLAENGADAERAALGAGQGIVVAPEPSGRLGSRTVRAEVGRRSRGRRYACSAGRRIFTAVAPKMRRTAFLIVRDWNTAEDMVQFTFVKLYVAWPRIREDGLEAYARRALMNVCFSHLRKHRRETVSDEIADPAVGPATSNVDLSRALALLPPRQRAVVALRYLDDLSVAQVADALGMAPGTVKSQTSRALTGLRALLPQLELDEEVGR